MPIDNDPWLGDVLVCRNDPQKIVVVCLASKYNQIITVVDPVTAEVERYSNFAKLFEVYDWHSRHFVLSSVAYDDDHFLVSDNGTVIRTGQHTSVWHFDKDADNPLRQMVVLHSKGGPHAT